MKPIVKIITTGVIVLAALGMIAYKYHDYMKYPWTRDGLCGRRLFRSPRAYPVRSFACRSRIISW
jgi:hypothetical protein